MAANEPSERTSAATKRGRIVFEAWVDVNAEHDVEKYLRQIERALANSFSISVHGSYPDARVSTRVEVTSNV